MVKLQPWRALKTFFGYAGSGEKRDIVAPEGLKNLTGGMLTFGKDSITAWYTKNIHLTQDRLQAYKEYDDIDADDIIVAALDLYAEDASQPSPTTGKRIWAEAEDPEVEKLVNDTLSRINADEQVFSITRETAKYGNSFSAIIQERKDDGTPGQIIQLLAAPVYAISRIEDENGRLTGFAVCPIEQMGSTLGMSSPGAMTQGKPTDPPWSFVHWRLLGKERIESYGTSMLAASRRCYRKLRMCLSGDTKISLLDGREVAIADLYKEYGPQGTFWVYSYDIKNQRVVTGQARNCDITRRNAELVRVTLDNGGKVKCTPDHPWMLRDGSYKEAKDLKPGDSLMPLYRRCDEYGYEQVKQLPLKGPRASWIYTHKRAVKGRPQAGMQFLIHHKNSNKRDNRPENLEWMTMEDHLDYHHNRMKALWQDPVFREKMRLAQLKAQNRPEVQEQRSKTLKESWKDPDVRQRRIDGLNRVAGETSKKMLDKWQEPEYIEKVKVAQRAVQLEAWKNPSEQRLEYLETCSERNANLWFNPKTRDRMLGGIRKRWSKENRQKICTQIATQFLAEAKILDGPAFIAWKKENDFNGFPSWSSITAYRPDLIASNHKVVSVEKLETREDCYDIEVDGIHNFALSAGCFVKNSEDILVIYRLKRAPDRFVFSIMGLAGMSPEQRLATMRKIRQELRKKHLINPQTGEVRQEIDPLGPDEDIIVDEESVKVTRLSGSTQVNPVMDIEYLRKRFMGTLKIPADYLGFSDAKSGFISDSPLSYQDINFSRVVKRLQASVMQGFALVCQIDMAWAGIDPRSEKAKFTMCMSPVSSLDEKMQLEVEKVRAEVLDTLQKIGADLGIDTDEWHGYLLQRSKIPVHLFRTSGKVKGDLLKGKVVVTEDRSKAIDKLVVESAKIGDEAKKRLREILGARILIKTFQVIRENVEQTTVENETRISLKGLFSPQGKPNTFESTNNIWMFTDKNLPVRTKGSEGALLESYVVTEWASAVNVEEIAKTKNLMTETIKKLKLKVEESKNKEKSTKSESTTKHVVPLDELEEFDDDIIEEAKDEKDTD